MYRQDSEYSTENSTEDSSGDPSFDGSDLGERVDDAPETDVEVSESVEELAEKEAARDRLPDTDLAVRASLGNNGDDAKLDTLLPTVSFVAPRGETERLCQSCFLIVPASRIDESTSNCVDCQ